MDYFKKISLSVILFTAGLCIALILSEFALRIFLPQNLSGSWLTKSRRGYSLNAPRDSVQHQFEDRKVSYTINSHHLRGPLPQKHAENILLLGDSFTFGWLLDEEQTLRSNLQALSDSKQKSYHFLNGGTGGWGTAQQFEFLKEFGKSLSLSQVIVLFNVNDAERNEKFITKKGRQQKNTQLGLLRDSALYQYALMRSHLLQFARRAYITLQRGESLQTSWQVQEKSVAADLPGDLSITRKLFKEIADWCQSHHIRLLVTTTGWFTEEKRERTLSGQFLQQAPQFFRELSVSFIDLSPEFLAHIQGREEEYYIPHDGHPNERANILLAKLLWKYLNNAEEEPYPHNEGAQNETSPQ